MDYTFAKTPDGAVQTSQGGKVISTGTADSAALNYGYKAPASAAPSTTTTSTTPAVQQTTTALRTAATQNSDALNTKLTQTNANNGNTNTNSTTTTVGPNAGKPGYDANGNPLDASGLQVARLNGGTYTGQDNNLYYKFDGSPATNAPATSTSGTTGGTAGSTTPGVNADGSYDLTTDAGIKAKLTSDVATANQTAQAQVTSANSTLDGISASSNASTQALIASIQSTFQASMQAMARTNQNILDAKTQSGIRSGITRYASGVQTSILTDEMQQGISRIATLNGQMLTAVAQAEQAQTAEDLTIFNDRMDQVNKIDTDLQNEVQNLQTTAMANLNQLQTAATNQANLQKQQQQEQLDMSTRVAPAVASQLASYTTPQAQADFLQEYSKQSGIPIDLLMGDVSAYSDTQTKNKLDLENVQNEIDNRNQQTQISQENADTAASKANATTSASDVYAAIDARINSTAVGGTYIVQDTGYFSKEGFQTLVQAAAENGISRADFIKQYANYLDPGAYAAYGLTTAEQQSLTGTNKTPAPVVVNGTQITS